MNLVRSTNRITGDTALCVGYDKEAPQQDPEKKWNHRPPTEKPFPFHRSGSMILFPLNMSPIEMYEPPSTMFLFSLDGARDVVIAQ